MPVEGPSVTGSAYKRPKVCPICGSEPPPTWGGRCSRAFCGMRGETIPANACGSCKGSGSKVLYAGNGGVSEIEKCCMCEGSGVNRFDSGDKR